MKTGKTLQWSILLGAALLAPLLLLVATPDAFGCYPGSTGNAVQCLSLAQVTSTDTTTPTITATLTLTATSTLSATSTLVATLTLTATPTLSETLPLTATETLTATATITPTATLKPTATLAPTPKGDSPDTARQPLWVKPDYCIEAMCPGAVNQPLLNSPGNWDWIPANSSIWYWMDDGHSLQVQIWVFANGQQGLALDVYAPEQKDLWNARPVGRGSQNKNYPGDDLFYSGRSAAYGIWHAKFTNNNPYPVYYTIRYTRTTPTLGNVCDNCHKAIGYEWNCTDPAFCQKLYDYLQTNPDCYSHNIDQDLAGNCR